MSKYYIVFYELNSNTGEIRPTMGSDVIGYIDGRLSKYNKIEAGRAACAKHFKRDRITGFSVHREYGESLFPNRCVLAYTPVKDVEHVDVKVWGNRL